MKTENDMYDVRFFGEPHERAMVPPNQIRPITTSLSAMQVMCASSHFISPYLISPQPITSSHLSSLVLISFTPPPPPGLEN